MTVALPPREARLIEGYLAETPGQADGYLVGVDPEGLPIVIWFCPDGNVRAEHYCRELEPGTWLRAAPALQLNGGHMIISRDPLTITPSLGCDDCGLHGFVTDGQWHDVGRGPARLPRTVDSSRSNP